MTEPLNPEYVNRHPDQSDPAETASTESSAAESGGAGAAAVIGQAGEPVVLNRPAPGQTVEVQAAAGETYVLNFAPGDAQVQVQGDNLILGFDDNGDGTVDSRIVFLDLATVAEQGQAPTFQIGEASFSSDVLLGQSLALAGEDQSPFEPPITEAGPVGGGTSTYNEDLGTTIGLLDAEDVIPPVELQFGLIEVEPEIILTGDDNTPPLADDVVTPAERGDPPVALLNALTQLGFGSPISPVTLAAFDTLSIQADTVEGSEGGGLPEILLFKQLLVDGDIGDDDTGEVADFGGSDVETPLEDLVFTLESAPAFGQLILITAGGDTSFLAPGDTFSSADTVWFVTTQSDVDAFMESEGLNFLPEAQFLYSVTDAEGASASDSVTINLPPLNDPTTALEPVCIDEDSEGTLSFSANANDSVAKITQIVISGFPTGEPADAWVVDAGSVDVSGLIAGVDYTATYDSASGELTIDFNLASVPFDTSITGTVSVAPNPDSDVDADLTIEANASNGSQTLTASAEAVAAVDADADGAEGSVNDDGDAFHLSVAASIADSPDEAGENTTFQMDEIGTLDISATFDDFLDGSETHTIVVKAPVGFTILGVDGVLPEGVTPGLSGGSVWTFDVETLDGIGAVDFVLQVQRTGGLQGETNFEVLVVAEETTTGDIECVDGGEGGIDPIAGDNVAFVTTLVSVTGSDVQPPEVALSLPEGVDCLAEDSAAVAATNMVTVTVTPVGDDEITEIVITGFQPDWDYDISGLEIPGAVLTDGDPSDGSITLTVNKLTAYSGVLRLAPPADSDVDHPTLTASATVVDPEDPLLTATGEGTLDIDVDAVADEVTVDITVNDSDDPETAFSANEIGTVRVVATFGDVADGSETHTVTVYLPEGFTAGDLSGLPAGVTAEVNGDVVFTVGAGVTELDHTFDVTAPAEVSSEDSFLFEATAVATETTTGDAECDPDNNLEDASDEQTVSGFFEEAPPVLIVGENVDDDANQTTPHRVHEPSSGQDYGEIIGDSGDDVLIGDVGGSDLTNKTMNLALVLDTSDSMEADITFNGEVMSRIEALDLAVEQLLDKISGADGATVRVHIVSFASDVKGEGTFDIITNGAVDEDELAAAKDFILAAGDNPDAVASGNTNYEAGFDAALQWFSNDANTLDNPDLNKTIFVSDGLPNRAFQGDDTTTVVKPSTAQLALDHVLGQFVANNPANNDTVNEFLLLQQDFKGVAGTVDAIGIATDADGTALLTQVDGDGANSINAGEELAELLDSLSQVTSLESVGDDVIIGGAADDLIFGDVLFTDELADDLSIDAPLGSGWGVIEDLVDDGFFDMDASKTEAEEIIDFLRDPANQALYDFGRESTVDGEGREGGNDLIDGGAGDDLIFGQEGDDIIVGGSGDDTMDGGSGADSFVWTADSGGGESDTVIGFDGAEGDSLNLSALLTGEDSTAGGGALAAFLEVTSDGTDTTIAVDANGDGSGYTDVTITLQGVDLTGGGADQATIIQAMLDNGNLVTN